MSGLYGLRVLLTGVVQSGKQDDDEVVIWFNCFSPSGQGS
jgi:hypothetical protein